MKQVKQLFKVTGLLQAINHEVIMVSYINQFHNTILQNFPVREHSRIKSMCINH